MTDYPGSIQDRQDRADRGGELIDRVNERERFAEFQSRPVFRWMGKEIKYDFCLLYHNRERPFSTGQILKSPLTDDSGITQIFIGPACVVATKTTGSRETLDLEHCIYVEQLTMIEHFHGGEMREAKPSVGEDSRQTNPISDQELTTKCPKPPRD